MARSVFRLFAECVDRFLSKFWCCGRCELKTKMASVDFSGFHRNVGSVSVVVFAVLWAVKRNRPKKNESVSRFRFFLGNRKTDPKKNRFRFAKIDRKTTGFRFFGFRFTKLSGTDLEHVRIILYDNRIPYGSQQAVEG